MDEAHFIKNKQVTLQSCGSTPHFCKAAHLHLTGPSGSVCPDLATAALASLYLA